MLTLSYGYLKPETGDHGSIFFPALEDDIQQLNDHNHDGVNSVKLTAQSVTGVKDTTSIVAANWVLVGGGTYRMVVTTPPNITYDDYARSYVITNGPDTGAEVNPTVVKISATQYYVYCNDNTVDMTILYLV